MCNSEKSGMDKKSQLLALGTLCKLLQKIESTDVVKYLDVFISDMR